MDLGGGGEHNIKRVSSICRDLPTAGLVLQDLEGPIKEAKVRQLVRAEVHDIFTPQLVKGKSVL